MRPRGLLLILALLSGGLFAVAQQTVSTSAEPSASANSAISSVPRIVTFSGAARDLDGKPFTGTVGITFLLYANEEGGAPIWLETQNVQADSSGHYSVQLGATKPDGLPTDVFTSGEARWLGVQISGQAEQTRVLLVSVPYALKAADAETIGGLPASAFVLANESQRAGNSARSATAPASSAAPKNAPPPANPNVTGKGTVGFIPTWDTGSDIVDSAIFQKSSAIGIGTTAPAATLDVNGKGDFRDTLTLFPKGTDSTLGINGTAFKIDQTGKVTFISGQTFPGAGTITGITTASGSGLSGGGTTGTLSLKVPSAGITNAMLQNSKITLNSNTAGGLTTPGAMTLGSTYTMGLKPCATKQILQYSGSSWGCVTLGTGTGTVTSVGSGPGLTGGPITTSGSLSIATGGVTNPMLQHSSLTLSAGTGLTGGGAVALGGSTSLSLNPAVVPELATANVFTNTNTVNAASSNPALKLTNTTGDGLDVTGGTSGYGVYIGGSGAGFDGMVVFGGYDGAYFNGPVAGSYSENDTNSNFSVAAYGAAYGSSAETFGLWGASASSSGIGTYGQAGSSSAEGASLLGLPLGVWGDTGISAGIGVFGSADDGWGLLAYNNSTTGYPAAFLESYENTNASRHVLEVAGANYGGLCSIDVSGNLTCNGSITPVVAAGGSRKVALNTISSPENWFEDAGSARLSNGEAVINIEAVFGQTVNTGVEYHVFLTPNGDCKGLYVAQKSPTSFVVRELGGGTSSIAFDYRIMAKRKGFEELRLVDKTLEMNTPRPSRTAGPRPAMPKPQDIRQEQEAHARAAHLAKPLLHAK